MIALGACVFSGLMTFQMSLVQGTHAQASTFFSLYAVTVVTTRWLLSRLVINVRPEIAMKVLLVMMVLGIVAMFAVPYHVLFQLAAAVLLGTGYGLVYPIIQTQAVNDSDAEHRRAALTWFVVSYFIGAFGFPLVGGWVLVHRQRRVADASRGVRPGGAHASDPARQAAYRDAFGKGVRGQLNRGR